MAGINRKRLEAACLGTVLVLAAVLRLWRLEANGFGTEYYAAGVRSALQGGALLFYNPFDPAGFISLDKPPVAFWIQAAFAKVLGFSGWAIHLPQALAGVASVALLYRLVRRPFGVAAATIAAPAAGPDADRGRDRPLQQHRFLAGLLPAARRLGGAARPRRVAGRWRWRCWASPSTSRCWRRWSAARRCWPAGGWPARSSWRRRLGWMAAAGVTLAVVSLSWSVAFDLTPQATRPYAGSTAGNSMLELVVVHNGLERFVRLRPERPGRSGPAGRATSSTTRCRSARCGWPRPARRAVRLAAAARADRPVPGAPPRPDRCLAGAVGRLARSPTASCSAPPAASSMSTISRRWRRRSPRSAGLGAVQAVAARPGLAGGRPRPVRGLADLPRRRVARLDVALARRTRGRALVARGSRCGAASARRRRSAAWHCSSCRSPGR